jgi:teichuronic acid biosynthesis glycosyltransferase TuaC
MNRPLGRGPGFYFEGEPIPMGCRPLHVLTLTPFYPVEGDDARGCFIAEPLPWLERYGIKNTVLAVQPFHRGRTPLSRSAPLAEWDHFVVPPGRMGLCISGAFLFASIFTKVRRIHRATRIDLIHAHAALPCGHAASLLRRKLGIPFVVTVHGNDAYSTYQVNRQAGRWCQRFSESVYTSAERVICISRRVSERVLENKKVRANIGIVYNGVDETLFSPSAEVNSQNILSVGNLISTKGHELLLRAFAAVHDDFVGATLEIIGDGPEREKLRELARELGIAGRTRFLGRRSRAEVAEAMRASAIFALPSRDEGLGCVYLEAMAAGEPTIACRNQGIGEIIQHGVDGWLIEPQNLAGMNDALLRLLRDSVLRKKIGLAARQTILRTHTLAHQAEKLAGIYRESLE